MAKETFTEEQDRLDRSERQTATRMNRFNYKRPVTPAEHLACIKSCLPRLEMLMEDFIASHGDEDSQLAEIAKANELLDDTIEYLRHRLELDYWEKRES